MNKLYNLSVERVKEACHRYWIDKDAGYFSEHFVCDDRPMIGICDPIWENVYEITGEHYQGYMESDDLCLVSARIAMTDKADENKTEVITDATVLCQLVDEDIQFKSIHMSQSDGKGIVSNRKDNIDFYYRKSLELVYDVVLEYQAKNNIFTYDSERYQRLFQQDTHFVNMDQWFWHMCTESVYEEDTEKLDIFRSADIEKRLRNNKNILSVCIRIKNKEKGLIWVKLTIVLIPNSTNTYIEGIMILMKNVDEEMKESMQNMEHARYDSLTQIWNRYQTEKLINEHLSEYGNGIFILMDVDWFKKVNDSFGHITGDTILKKIASSISEKITDNDIFGRIGGDEFVLFLKESGNDKETMDKISNILKAVYFEYSERDMHMTMHCSAGVAIVNKNLCTFQALYEAADKALYDAKRSGRNTFRII